MVTGAGEVEGIIECLPNSILFGGAQANIAPHALAGSAESEATRAEPISRAPVTPDSIPAEGERDLGSLEYGLARDTEARLGAFRLIHNAYVRAGLGEPSPVGMRVTPFQIQPQSQIFVGSLGAEVVSTVSLIGDGEAGLPMESMFGPEVQELRAAGERVSEVSCLADRRQDVRRFLPAFRGMTRPLAQLARYEGIGNLLITVNPRHVKFYTHYLGFVPISRRVADCPHVQNRPAVALRLNFIQFDLDRPPCWDHYFSSWIPRDELRPYTIGQYEREMLRALAIC